jgi:hypothetical protein
MEFYVAVVPSKIEMYPEKLPSNFQLMNGGDNGSRASNKFVDHQRVNGIDLHASVATVKAANEGAYFKNDNHWTSIGSFAAYQRIMERMAVDFPGTYDVPEFNDFDHRVLLSGGVVRTWCPLDDIPYELHDFPKVPGKVVFDGNEWKYEESQVFSFPNKFEVVRVNPTVPAKKKVMIIRDSFGSALEAFFPKNVYLTSFLWDRWQYRLNPEIVMQENPEVVVLLIIEGNLDDVNFSDWDSLALKNSRMDLDHFVRETEHNESLMQQLEAKAQGNVDALDQLVFEQSQHDYSVYLESIGSTSIYASMERIDSLLTADETWRQYVDKAAKRMDIPVPMAQYHIADSINKAFVWRLPSWE